MKRMKGSRAFMALFLAVVMILGNALAGTYYIEDGSIEIHASETSQTVTQADNTQNDNALVISNKNPETSSANTVTIISDKGCTASVTVKDLNIDVRAKDGTPAVITEGAGDVNIELDGNISLKSGAGSAGLQKENTGNLTINDTDQNGRLEAVGSSKTNDVNVIVGGAGIGGGDGKSGENIIINGGKIIATGGSGGAGIGGGDENSGENIIINGGKVTATGGTCGAGIGGGTESTGTNITINGGEVTANGGNGAAGIGNGFIDISINRKEATDITITGGKVTANGGEEYGAGIGGGNNGTGKNIMISGGEVTATGGKCGAGIGGGHNGSGEKIKISGGEVIAIGGQYGAGIGGGDTEKGESITISGGKVIATGGESGAGIGGGGDCSSYDNIEIKYAAQVSAAGGDSVDEFGTGAAIGGGGVFYVAGYEAEFQASDLTCGSIEYYAPGTKAEDIKNGTAQPESGKKIDNPDIDHDYEWMYNETHHWHACTNDGCVHKENEAAHTWEDYGGSAATCTTNKVKPGKRCKCGKILEEPEEVPDTATGHHWETVWSKDGTKHWHKCQNEGCTAVKDEAAHNFATFVERTKDPTCTETGTDLYQCICGVTTEVAVKATGHAWDTEWSADGTKHWHKCLNDGCTAVKDEAAHDYATFVKNIKDPTCTETGTDLYQCTCGATTEVVVKANGHTPAAAVKENEKVAQVGVAGSYDEVVYCSACGEELSRKTVKTDPLPDETKMLQGSLAAFCGEVAKQIRQAPENGTVEADAGSFDCLTRVVFKALGERPDVTLKLQTKEGVITIPAGAGLLEKIGGKNTVSFTELKEILQ